MKHREANAGVVGGQLCQSVREVFYRFNIGAEVSTVALAIAFRAILEHQENRQRDVLLGGILTALMARNPTVEQIVALLSTAFSLDGHDPANALRVRLPAGKKLIGVAGSGKKGIKTLNISTAGALVAASAGAYIAKPGSSSVSSITGSADFMSEVGFDVTQPVPASVEVLRKTGFGFFSVENMIPRFDRVYGSLFHTPHVLSFGLAALLCPVKTDALLYGLAHPNVELSIKVLREFGIETAMVIACTHDDIHFLDEIGIYGNTRLIGMRHGNIGRLLSFLPTEELNLPRYEPSDIAQASNRQENVRRVLKALAGKGIAAHRDIIAINAANLLFLAGLAEDRREGFRIAKRTIDRGLALEKLEEVVSVSGGAPSMLRRRLAVGWRSA